MKTIQNLKKVMLQAKKNKDKERARVLIMIIDGAEKEVKANKTAEEKAIIISIKKYLKNIDESLKSGMDVKDEKDILEDIAKDILPKQLGETQLKHIILEYKNDNPKVNMGMIMGYLKKTFGDQVDMGMASKIVKTIG